MGKLTEDRKAALVVWQLDDDLVARAKAVGRSAEAEHRLILEKALRRYRSGAELWSALRGDGPRIDRDFDDAISTHDQPAEPPHDDR